MSTLELRNNTKLNYKLIQINLRYNADQKDVVVPRVIVPKF